MINWIAKFVANLMYGNTASFDRGFTEGYIRSRLTSWLIWGTDNVAFIVGILIGIIIGMVIHHIIVAIKNHKEKISLKKGDSQ